MTKRSYTSLPAFIIVTVLDFNHSFMCAAAAKSLQSCPTLCDPIDGSPPGSPAPGILQARTLEWGAIAFGYLILICNSLRIFSYTHVLSVHLLWGSVCSNLLPSFQLVVCFLIAEF